MTQIIGHEPALHVLNLVDGQDLSHVFEVVGDPIPVGSLASMEVSDREHDYTYAVWPIIETGAGWALNVAAADHADIPHGARFRVYVTYPTAGRYCWIAGPVNRSRR
ncbi:hypothetical protein A5720_11930 [Mycolicibacterium conceptionense]|uniref:LtfC/p132/Gp6 beta-sandwich domain-containing protein n=1 Tax=Mycolicibacterium conceptionense TaxID=451644 RepID=A0A1A1YEU2_9MYCO|nr:hypothetical protein A5726_30050 [Mycolicibacterium conceptionense]OBF43729.1 hypothetical protein A5720_11930 [Mycolicibacterium conceptionense]OBH99373.1 hypothetical protein A5716_00370 [Mycolicibacterium conceptionense]